MHRLRFVVAVYAGILLASCGEPALTPTAPDEAVPADSDFETAEIRVGQVRTRIVPVPAGYSLVDMNSRGDLLLGAAWLPVGEGGRSPSRSPGAPSTTTGRSSAPAWRSSRATRVTNLPDPCIPFSITLVGDSDKPVGSVRLLLLPGAGQCDGGKRRCARCISAGCPRYRLLPIQVLQGMARRRPCVGDSGRVRIERLGGGRCGYQR